MFGVFGEIIFTLLSGPRTFESSRCWDYAEHRVVEDRSRLQWTGDGLERISLEMMFHASFTNPTAQLAALLAAASDHNARPLVLGNGDHRGYFVLTAVTTTLRQMSDDGDTIELMVRSELTEWALSLELDATATPRPTFIPLGLVATAVSTGETPIYTASLLAAPGVSPILNTLAALAAAPNGLLPADIAPRAIVRSVA